MVAEDDCYLVHPCPAERDERALEEQHALHFEGELVDAVHALRFARGEQRGVAAHAAGRPVLVNAWLDRTEFREGSISM